MQFPCTNSENVSNTRQRRRMMFHSRDVVPDRNLVRHQEIISVCQHTKQMGRADTRTHVEEARPTLSSFQGQDRRSTHQRDRISTRQRSNMPNAFPWRTWSRAIKRKQTESNNSRRKKRARIMVVVPHTTRNEKQHTTPIAVCRPLQRVCSREEPGDERKTSRKKEE